MPTEGTPAATAARRGPGLYIAIGVGGTLLVAAIIALVVVLIAQSGGADSAAASGKGSSTAENLSLGQTIDVTTTTGAEGQVTLANASLQREGLGEYDSDPENGGFIIVDIAVAAKSGVIPYNPYQFQFQGPDGTTVQPNSGNAILSGWGTPRLDSGTLTAGQRATGKIVFDVSSSSGKLVLTGGGGRLIGSWNIYLG
jgi:hypothetical protein